MIIKRGDIFYANLSPVIGSEQAGIRPVLIIQNDIGNRFSPTVVALPITSKEKTDLPTHISISKKESGLEKNSVVLVEQIRTLDKSRLLNKVGHLSNVTMELIKESIKKNLKLRVDIKDLFE